MDSDCSIFSHCMLVALVMENFVMNSLQSVCVVLKMTQHGTGVRSRTKLLKL